MEYGGWKYGVAGDAGQRHMIFFSPSSLLRLA